MFLNACFLHQLPYTVKKYPPLYTAGKYPILYTVIKYPPLYTAGNYPILYTVIKYPPLYCVRKHPLPVFTVRKYSPLFTPLANILLSSSEHCQKIYITVHCLKVSCIVPGLGKRSFKKKPTFLRSFQKNTMFSCSFAFFIKRHCVLCVLLHSL